MAQHHRRLAAILFTDIVGYTALMQRDEQAATAMIQKHHEVMEACVPTHNGEVHSFYGDGCLCIFASVTEAMRAAIDVQQQFQSGLSVPLRIGLHIGEIFFEQGKVMGDGVNIASRIQSLGGANTILFSREIFDKLRNQSQFQSVLLGKFEFKNVDEPMEVYALANEGLAIPRKEGMTGKLKESKKKNTSRKLVIGVGLLIVLAGLAYFLFFKSKSPVLSNRSIAVLPFENTGTDQVEGYVSDGISQDIISNLSKISSIQKVIGWFSVKRFRKTEKSLKDIARELDVNIILTGTIRRSSNKIKVIVELIEVAGDRRIWGDEYTFDSSNFLSVQSDVATQIVTALKANLSPEEKAGLVKHYTENVEAYKCYRIGRAFWDARSAQSFDSAEAYYKKALQLDPDYALAYAGLADCYTYNQRGIPQLESVPIGRDYAQKALSIDSNLSEALTTRGWIEGAFDYNWKKSKASLQKAIQLSPNYPLAHMYYGNLLQYTGESSAAGLKEVKKALELDPLSVSINWVLGRNYYFDGQLDLATQQAKKSISLDPKFVLAKGSLIFITLKQKKFDEALISINQLPKKHPWVFQGTYLPYAYGLMGDSARAKIELEKAIAENPNISRLDVARAYASIGKPEFAIDELEKAVAIKDIQIYYLKVEPSLVSLRKNPRYIKLLKSVGLE